MFQVIARGEAFPAPVRCLLPPWSHKWPPRSSAEPPGFRLKFGRNKNVMTKQDKKIYKYKK